VTTEELKRLRELCEKATKGEWYEDCGCVEDSYGMATIATCGHGGIVIDQYRADARFIAAARTALPALLDEVEKLKRVIAEAHNIATGKAVGEFNDGDDVVAAIRTKLSEAV
jgi:hypothetical protein